MLTCDQWILAESLEHALHLLGEAPAGSRLVSGATDTLPWARQGRGGDMTGDAHVPMVIDISGLSALSGYEKTEGGRIRLGANLVFEDFLEDAELARSLPVMPHCAVWFADDQIRRQATIAGNVVNASPAADGTTALMALDARLELARLEGGAVHYRDCALSDFVTGPGDVAMDRNAEIVTALSCDATPGYGAAFEKVGHRRSLVISTVCVACSVKPSADGERFADIRLSIGGVGPKPFIALGAQSNSLRGQPIRMDLIGAMARPLSNFVASRTRVDYRRHALAGMIERAVVNALADAGIAVKEMADA